MEALLLLIDIIFFIGLAYRVMRAVKSDEKLGLGFFGYIEHTEPAVAVPNEKPKRI